MWVLVLLCVRLPEGMLARLRTHRVLRAYAHPRKGYGSISHDYCARFRVRTQTCSPGLCSSFASFSSSSFSAFCPDSSLYSCYSCSFSRPSFKHKRPDLLLFLVRTYMHLPNEVITKGTGGQSKLGGKYQEALADKDQSVSQHMLDVFYRISYRVWSI